MTPNLFQELPEQIKQQKRRGIYVTNKKQISSFQVVSFLTHFTVKLCVSVENAAKWDILLFTAGIAEQRQGGAQWWCEIPVRIILRS